MHITTDTVIKVRLTDRGRKILQNHLYPKEEVGGVSEWRLWELMSLFGVYMRLGKVSPFDEQSLEIVEG